MFTQCETTTSFIVSTQLKLFHYRVIIDKTAMKFISKQSQQEKIRILRAIYRLPDGDILKMSGKLNLYRLRIGSYRIIYTVEENKLIIRVIEAGNRGDIYEYSKSSLKVSFFST